MDPQGRYVAVRGTRLYVYELGDAGAPALLYLHGGPGTGCHEFVRWQGRALAAGVRLLAFDQRGFHHSDPVAADEALSEDVFVEDCEALRAALGVDAWFVLGHSYGGRLATRYAARYPEAVRGVVFDAPAWSVERTQRFRMPVFAAIYESHGLHEQARQCREFAAAPDIFAGDPLRMDLIAGVTALGEAWYLYDRSAVGFFDAVALAPPAPDADERALRLLSTDPLNNEDLSLLLPDLKMPACLIVGEADLVTSPDQIEDFAAAFGPENVHRVGGAGHYVQGEQPEAYARLVLEFVRGAAAARPR